MEQKFPRAENQVFRLEKPSNAQQNKEILLKDDNIKKKEKILNFQRKVHLKHKTKKCCLLKEKKWNFIPFIYTKC